MNFAVSIKKFVALQGVEQKLLIRGMLVFCYAAVMINLLPVRYYRSLLSANKKNFAPHDSAKRKLVVKTVRRIKKHFPLHSSCLLLSIISLQLSKILGINCSIRYALRINPNRIMTAHSYVVFDDVVSLFRNTNYRDVC